MNSLFTGMDLLALLILYFLYFYPRWHTTKEQLFLKTVCYIYMAGVAYVTLLPWFLPIPFITADISLSTVNLVPFVDIIEGHGGAWKEVFLNIIMMIPFGILLPMIYHKKGWNVLLWTLGTSVLIEILQLCSVWGLRSSDITDVISNTLGGGIGYGIYLIAHRLALTLIHIVFPPTSFTQPPKLSVSSYTSNIIYAIMFFLLLVKSLYIPFQWLN